MRDTVIHKLIDLGKKDKDIELITGDLGFGVLKPFWETLPDQFVNAGIAEQNMALMAAGMAGEKEKAGAYRSGCRIFIFWAAALFVRQPLNFMRALTVSQTRRGGFRSASAALSFSGLL